MQTNQWKLLQNQRLPPVMNSYWSYNQDSWTYQPKEYEELPLPKFSFSGNWFDWLHHEQTVKHPIARVRGGLSDKDNIALTNASINFPDIASETTRNNIILQNYLINMHNKKMQTQRTVYDGY